MVLRMAAIPFGLSFLLGAESRLLAAGGVVPSARVFTAADVPWIVTVTTIFASWGIGCVCWGLGCDRLECTWLRMCFLQLMPCPGV